MKIEIKVDGEAFELSRGTRSPFLRSESRMRDTNRKGAMRFAKRFNVDFDFPPEG